MLSELVLFLRLVVGPVVGHLEQVEVVLVAVLAHLVVKHFVGHEHVAPELRSRTLVALWHVEDFLDGGLKVGAPHRGWVHGHGDFHHDFVLLNAGSRLPSVFAEVGQEREAEVLDGQAGHGVGGGQ